MSKFYQLDKYLYIKINGDRGRKFLQGQASCDLNANAKPGILYFAMKKALSCQMQQ